MFPNLSYQKPWEFLDPVTTTMTSGVQVFPNDESQPPDKDVDVLHMPPGQGMDLETKTPSKTLTQSGRHPVSCIGDVADAVGTS